MFVLSCNFISVSTPIDSEEVAPAGLELVVAARGECRLAFPSYPFSPKSPAFLFQSWLALFPCLWMALAIECLDCAYPFWGKMKVLPIASTLLFSDL